MKCYSCKYYVYHYFDLSPCENWCTFYVPTVNCNAILYDFDKAIKYGTNIEIKTPGKCKYEKA